MIRRRHCIGVLFSKAFTEGPTKWHISAEANKGMFFDDATHALEFARAVKTPQEIEKLRRANEVAVFGLEAFRGAIRHGMALAGTAEAALRRSGRWEIVTPAQLGVFTFCRGGADTLTERIGDRMRSRLYEMCKTVEMAGKDFRKEVKEAQHHFNRGNG